MRVLLKTAILVCCLAMFTVLFGVASVAQDKAKVGQLPKAEQRVGKVVTVESDKLPKFKEPRHKPDGKPPEDRKGGHWHWHNNHGWVWLPIEVFNIKAGVILGPTYVLPKQVVYYHQEAAVALAPACVLGCPHCGKQIIVTVHAQD